MSVKLNKTAMIDEYINNNIEMLVNSNKSLEELCEDFNKNNDKKVSFSSFYKSFKQISKDKGLTKQRTRKSKHQRMLNEVKKDNKNDNEKFPLVPPEEAKRLLPDSDEEETSEEEETPMQKMLHRYKEDNIDKLRFHKHNRIYGVERHLNNYEAQTFEISKYFPSYYSGYRFIIDTDKWFRVNLQLYAPIVLIISETSVYTNEEYNATFKTSHPKSHNNYTNVVRIPNGEYKYKYYVVYDDGDGRTYEPFAKTDFSECDDILQLLAYERYEDLPEEEWDNNKQSKEQSKEQNEEEQNEEIVD